MIKFSAATASIVLMLAVVSNAYKINKDELNKMKALSEVSKVILNPIRNFFVQTCHFF
jgi:hypothetical protein